MPFSQQCVLAQNVSLPEPGTLVGLSQAYTPLTAIGINIYPDNPLKFDFIIDQGDTDFDQENFQAEAQRLIKYFLASLTIPEKQMWVNLSPYEKNRIIPEEFGKTEMGRDLLALDYMLKQLSSSLMDPDKELGSEFWDRIYEKAMAQYGSMDIPVNTFNKIWIVPENATIYQHEKGAVILDTHLKVMLEEDYLALEANQNSTEHGLGNIQKNDLEIVSGVSKEIVNDILIPEIEKEVNSGITFAPLRQIYNSMLLASWYKKTLKKSLLGEVYMDQEKTQGIEIADKDENLEIYNQYIESFKKGVFNFVKEEYNPETQSIVPKKYFSGGVRLNEDFALVTNTSTDKQEGKIKALINKINSSVQVTFGLASDKFSISILGKEFETPFSVSPKRLNQMFDRYLENDEYLKNYKDTPLRKAFTPDIMRALLVDSSLRPAFMLKLSEEKGQVGPLQDVDHEIVDQIGGEALLEQYTSFLVGNANAANKSLEQGDKILVGLTDRFSSKSLFEDRNAHQVANRRQIFFPLDDGSWLGVKGSGDFKDEKAEESFHVFEYSVKVYGLADEEEAKNATKARPKIKNSNFRSVEYLGFRILNVLTDGKGGLIDTNKNNPFLGSRDQKVQNAVLIFNRVLSPHRTTKLPQLLNNDPGLSGLWKNISTTLKKQNKKAPKNVSELLYNMIDQLAINSAFRHNNNLYKETIHPQDFTFAGEESDNEEFITYEEMLNYIKGSRYYEYSPYVQTFFEKYKFNIADLTGMGYLFYKMADLSKHDSPLQKLFPQPISILKTFFESYFHHLSDENLSAWLNEYDVIEFGNQKKVISRALQMIYAHQELQTFHANPSGNEYRDRFEVLLAMQEWLEAEAKTRQAVTSPQATSKETVSPDILMGQKYLVPGYRKIKEGDKAFGNALYPGFDERLSEQKIETMKDIDYLFGNLLQVDKHLQVSVMQYILGKQSLSHIIDKLPAAFEEREKKWIQNDLCLLRVSSKYNLPYRIISDFSYSLMNMSIVEAITEEKNPFLKSILQEIDVLGKNDIVATPEVLFELSHLDLGDESTLEAVDYALATKFETMVDLLRDSLLESKNSEEKKYLLTLFDQGEKISGPISRDALNRLFDKYMEDNEILGPYRNTEIKEAFTPEIMIALIQDKSLRPAFMVPMTEREEMVGPLQDVDQDTVDSMGGEALLNKYTSFLIGDTQTALEALKSGEKIIVGVTDKPSYNAIRSLPVANRRQIYFPLEDGWWLGIKGAGDFLDEEPSQTFIVNESDPEVMGLVREAEVKNASLVRDQIKNTEFLAVNYLGYRVIKRLTDGKGGWIDTKINNPFLKSKRKTADEAVLVFNRVMSPHRTTKISQLMENDKNLRYLHHAAASLLERQGRAVPKNSEELLFQLTRQLAINNAFRHNHFLYKYSLHTQDFTFLGEESDNEEFVTFAQLLESMKNERYFANAPYTQEFFEKYKYNLTDLNGAIVLLFYINEKIISSDENFQFLQFHPTELIKEFFTTYLKKLSDQHLKAWIEEYDIISLGDRKEILSRPLQSIFAFNDLEYFHPQGQAGDIRQRFEVMLTIQNWVKEEVSRRDTLTYPTLNSKETVSANVLMDAKYLIPGYRTDQMPESYYQTPLSPAFDPKVIEHTIQIFKHVFKQYYSIDMDSLANPKENITLYASGKQTLQQTIEYLLNQPQLQSESNKENLKKTLPLIRIISKYDLRRGEDIYILLHLSDHDGSWTKFPFYMLELIKIKYDKYYQEVADLIHTDRIVSEDVLNKIWSIDLGDETTLQAVDYATAINNDNDFRKGGIDLNPEMVDVNLVNANNHAPAYTFDMSEFSDIEVEGFTPDIIEIHSLADSPQLIYELIPNF